MADDNNIELNLTADTSDAAKSLKRFEDSAEKSISNVVGFYKTLAGAAAAALAYVGAKEVVSFFIDSANAAAENEAEVAKLEASLKSLGEFTPDLVEDFKSFADELENSSKFSDDAAIAQLAFAKQLGLTNDDAKKLVQTAADLASVTGDSLEGAVSELSKTLTGTAGALKKTIPEVAAFSEEQLKAGDAIDFVAERLKGAAANSIQTYQGSLIKLGNAQEDFQKSVGSIITQNPVLIEVLKVASDTFGDLQKLVDENKEEITAFATALIKATVNAIPVAVRALGTFVSVMGSVVKGLAALTAVTADTIAGFLKFGLIQDIISGTVQGVQQSIADLIDAFAFLLDVIGNIPGASSAFDALGISIDDVRTSLSETSLKFRDLSKTPIDFSETIAGLEDIRDGAVDFANSSDIAFEGAEKAIAAVEKVVRTNADKIIDADGDMAKSAKAAALQREIEGQKAVRASVDASKARAKALEDEKEGSKDREKLIEQKEKFLDRILAKESDGLKKLEIERKRDLEELENLQAKGIVSLEEGEKIRQAIVEDSEAKQLEIRKKAISDFEKKVTEISASPIKIILPAVEVDPSSIEEAGSIIAASLGTLKTVLDGKQGAVDFVAGIAGAVVNLYFPGLGGVVSELVKTLTQTPEQLKAQVEAFFDSFPEIIDNIAESGPAIAEGLVDSLINRGGIIKIAAASVKSLVGFTQTSALGRVIGRQFTDHVGPALLKGLQDVALFFVKVFDLNLGAAFQKVGTFFQNALIGPLAELFVGLEKVFTDVFGGFFAGINTTFASIGTAFSSTIANAFNAVGPAITAVFDSFIKNLKAPFEFFLAQFKNVFNDPIEAIRKAIQKPFDSLKGIFDDPIKGLRKALTEPFDSFKEFLSKFKFPDINIPGVGGGGGGSSKGPITGIKGSPLAKGGIVPPGFPNDSFPARMTSKEMALPPDIASGLIDLIRSGGSSGDDDEASLAILTQLNKIGNLLAQPQQVTTTAELDGKAFAQIILQLNRQNARLTA